jgi:excisionase family DNA binding protein
MTTEEVAQFLGVRRKFVYALVERGEIEALRPSGRRLIRFTPQAVANYLDASQVA